MKDTIKRTVFKDRIEYTLNGYVHRTDGPAVIEADGTERWYLNGELTKIVYSDGKEEWYVIGKK